MAMDDRQKSNCGRPRVDSEMVRARIERPLLDALDHVIADHPSDDRPSRPDLIRTILRDWLQEAGYLPRDENSST
jgi:hypothetical protein